MFRLPPPAPVHVDLDTSFPRTDWGEWEYGPPPYGDRLDDSRVLWAGREASRAFGAALVPGGSWKVIDPTCFKLAVYDKANELREAWRDGQTGDVFETHREWKASLPRFVRMAYEAAKRTVLSAHPNVDQSLFGRYDEIEDFCLRSIDLGCPTGSDTWAFDPDLTPILGPELGRWDADHQAPPQRTQWVPRSTRTEPHESIWPRPPRTPPPATPPRQQQAHPQTFPPNGRALPRSTPSPPRRQADPNHRYPLAPETARTPATRYPDKSRMPPPLRGNGAHGAVYHDASAMSAPQAGRRPTQR